MDRLLGTSLTNAKPVALICTHLRLRYASQTWSPQIIGLLKQIECMQRRGQGCALRETEGSPVLRTCLTQDFHEKNGDFLATRDLTLGATGHRALFKHSLACWKYHYNSSFEMRWDLRTWRGYYGQLILILYHIGPNLDPVFFLRHSVTWFVLIMTCFRSSVKELGQLGPRAKITQSLKHRKTYNTVMYQFFSFSQISRYLECTVTESDKSVAIAYSMVFLKFEWI